MKKNISIIIPVYNVEKYISECLESVLGQYNVDFEIICINDGSTDSSLEIINKYAKENKSIKLFSQENKGLSETRNRGIDLASNDYIYFLDGDDLLSNQYVLSDLLMEVDIDDLDLIEFDAKSFFENEELKKKNTVYQEMYRRDYSYGYYNNGRSLLSELIRNNKYYCSACLRLYRKEFLLNNKIRFIEGVLYEDNCFTLECYIKAKKVYHSNQVVMLRRIRNNSITQKKVTFYNYLSYVKILSNILDLWENNDDDKTSDIFKYVTSVIRNTTIDVYLQLDESEKEKIKGLSSYTRYFIQREGLQKSSDGIGFFFPYHLFHPKQKVSIYGAGIAGKALYKIARKDGIIAINGIVDKKGDMLSEENIKVDNLDYLGEHKDDIWLISIINKNIAKEVKEMLLQEGIQEENIRWDGPAYCDPRKSIQIGMMARNFMERSLSYKKEKRIFVFLQPEHGNIGDYAISLGENYFLREYYNSYHIVWITSGEWEVLSDYISNEIDDDDIIFFNGGGYLGDLWNSWRMSKEIMERFKDNIKILFPNTLSYKNAIDENNVSLREDLEWIEAQKNLYIMLRDINSYRYMQRQSKINSFYAPDMALFINNSKSVKNKVNNKILLCFRDDKEKVIDDNDKIEERLVKYGYTVINRDIHLSRYISLKEGYAYFWRALSEIEQCNLVITDRLHGAILSVLAGTPCIALDNLTKKVSGVMPWFDTSAVILVDNLSDIDADIVKKMMSYDYTKKKNYTSEFERVHEYIDEILFKCEKS